MDDSLIRRSDAIDALCNAMCELDVEHYPKCDQAQYCDEVSALLSLPSADRPTGEWIDHQEDGYVECPFCGHATTCEDNKDELHFCFYCGADMRGEDDGSCE